MKLFPNFTPHRLINDTKFKAFIQNYNRKNMYIFTKRGCISQHFKLLVNDSSIFFALRIKRSENVFRTSTMN